MILPCACTLIVEPVESWLRSIALVTKKFAFWPVVMEIGPMDEKFRGENRLSCCEVNEPAAFQDIPAAPKRIADSPFAP